MHWNVEQILWALVLAAHLVLLVVLLGRERTSRFPFFTSVIVLSVVRLLADHLLHGKLTTLAFYWQSYSSMLLDSILGILVLVELTRKVFANCKSGLILKRNGWLGWTLISVGLAGLVLWFWGPWPTWTALRADPAQLPLLLVVLTAMKSQIFVGIVTIEAALLMRIFGTRFKSGWRSHPQQIALGLSTYAIGVLAVQGISDSIKRSVHLTSREQYERIVHLFTNLDNARSALWILVLIWWIVWLWRDEPTPGTTPALVEVVAPVGPPVLSASVPLEVEADDEADSDFRH